MVLLLNVRGTTGGLERLPAFYTQVLTNTTFPGTGSSTEWAKFPLSHFLDMKSKDSGCSAKELILAIMTVLIWKAICGGLTSLCILDWISPYLCPDGNDGSYEQMNEIMSFRQPDGCAHTLCVAST